ncbi:MAG: xylulokinase [Candidatus Firestonebacteria bacterium RIFOXYA2_FULL_40_8]|nr:MAG: xylulokinase [Candidatus Firestonebacteria bacterium RIFOXYA2_FULL_40_8]
MGIDIGTSGTKVILIDIKGKVIATDLQEYPLYTPKPGWAEQNPDDWWNAAVKGIKNVVKGVKTSEIAAIGLSGQMHGLVALDRNNKILRPAILWCDQRTVKQCDYITKKIGAERLKKLVYNPALTGFTAGKILWMRDNEPALYKKINKVLLPKDYIRFKLTGIFATEVSDASGMLLLDVKNRKWSETLLKELKIKSSILGECFESEKISGYVNSEAAKLTGLAYNTPVGGGGGDQSASAIGCGIVETGIISVTIGTSGVVFAFSDKIKLDKQGRIHTFCHAVNGKWHTMGVMLSAGGSLKWFKDNLCKEEIALAAKKKVDPYDIILKDLDKIPPGSDGLIFLPYLSGERSPYADPYARGVFLGLGLAHTKKHMAKAVLEGVTFGLRDTVEIMRALKIPIKEIRVTGGGARSKLWLQMLADIFGQEVVTVNVTEGGALGVALLAGVGAGIYPDISAVCKKIITTKKGAKPNKKNVKIYNRYYKLYEKTYVNLRDEFKELAGLQNR